MASVLVHTADENVTLSARAARLLLEKGGVIPLYGAGCCYRLGEGLTGLIGNGVGVYYFFQIHEISHS